MVAQPVIWPWKALLAVIALVTALALWLLLSFLLPGIMSFIQHRGLVAFLAGVGPMVLPAIVTLGLSVRALRRPGIPSGWLFLALGAACAFTIFLAFQFAMY